MNTDQYKHIEEDYGEYYISDTRITVRNVVDSLSVESTTPQELSDSWDVPVESIHEAVNIYEKNERELTDIHGKNENFYQPLDDQGIEDLENKDMMRLMAEQIMGVENIDSEDDGETKQ